MSEDTVQHITVGNLFFFFFFYAEAVQLVRDQVEIRTPPTGPRTRASCTALPPPVSILCRSPNEKQAAETNRQPPCSTSTGNRSVGQLSFLAALHTSENDLKMQ